ncbi:MAG: trypsin-like peptidase domain-containing protein, partial [Chroococcales cyanobacterium]
MNRYRLSLILSLLLLPPSTLYLTGCLPQIRTSQAQKILSTPEVEKVAERITVRVIVGENQGSGTIIKREGELYTVLTNRHVIELGDSYTIQTLDGKTHSAQLRTANTGYDLALLQFTSNDTYTVATVGNPLELEVGEGVYAAGFPYNQNELQVSRGKFSMWPDLALEDGYALGYTNDVIQGMSGGAILNREGKLIGINGRSAFPIEPHYEFEDGTKPSQELVEKMIPLSWGVPISTVGKIAPNLIPTPIPKLTGIAAKVNDIAEKITVRIEFSHNNGSGVIVAKDGNTYYVLTNDHVMDKEDDYEIVTPDGKRHSVDYDKVTRFEGVDLAVVPFRSRESYTVAQLANYRLGADDRALVFSSGWAKGNPYRRFTAGYIFSEERGTINLNDSSSLSQTRGYELVYTNLSHPGMSGGPILDVEGRLIGINAGADGDTEEQGFGEFHLGYSYGVPIRTFLGLAKQAKIESDLVSVNTSAPQSLALALKDVIDIFPVFYSFTTPSLNGSAGDWLNYGNSLWRTGDYEEAIKALDEAIQRRPIFYQA